jgi:hypothetical protein
MIFFINVITIRGADGFVKSPPPLSVNDGDEKAGPPLRRAGESL